MAEKYRYLTCLRKYGYWKLQFPAFSNEKPMNFHFSNYGGEDGALKAAISYRDTFLKSIGLHKGFLYGYIKNNREYANNLCFHRYGNRIIGSWMAGEGDNRKQRKISRSFGEIRTEEQAFALVVEAIYKAVKYRAGKD